MSDTTVSLGLRRAVDAPVPRTEVRPAALARVEVLHDFAAAERIWRDLEAGGALVTPYERYDYLALWQQHVGTPAGITPVLIVGYDLAGAPSFLWPLGLRRYGRLRLLGGLGGRQANFRTGLWRRDVADTVTAAQIAGVLRAVGRQHGVDLVALRRHQAAWDGVANPFTRLPHQSSPDANHATALGATPQPTSQMRRQLRSKERRLAQLPGYRYVRAETAAEVDRFLGRFFALKAAHFASQGVTNVFDEPGVGRFLRAASHAGLADGRPLVELHAIEADGEMLALFAGPNDGRRFSCLFNTYTLGAHARLSPGLVLLQHVTTALRARNVACFDLGIGHSRYKTTFCRDEEPLVDCFVPVTALGFAAALAARVVTAGKRRIKRAPAVYAAAQRLRRRLFGKTPAPGA